MSIFLCLKEIVDVLYQFRFLDYFAVSLAFLLMAFVFFKKQQYRELYNKITLMDFIVMALAVVYFLSYLRNTGATSQFIKTESAFFIYFFGRIMGPVFIAELKGDRWLIRALPLVSYVIVYANFIYKMYIQATYIVTGKYVGRNQDFDIHSDGALYYYKTDMAIGVIICLIFIYALSKKAWLKWITLVPVGIFMVFFETEARSGQAILLLEYAIIIFLELRKRGRLTRIGLSLRSVKAVSLVIMLALTGFFIFLQVFAPLKVRLEDLGLSEGIMNRLESIFHSRHLIWWDAISHYVQQGFCTRLLGIDLCSETLYNSAEDRFHNLYFKQVYATGYIGTYLFYIMCCLHLKGMVEEKKKDFCPVESLGKIKYMTVAFWVMWLFISISMEGLEYTQMTWYPFIFMGIMQGGKNDTGKIPL